ncbi:DNA damage-inducible transcript 4-like protein [Salarias fasciatus]|uniref:DNA damage-inducible transcript 4-like protein n=1 Tax=Salarias fasciatus TaxID=181472 RepID=A0A672HCJ2_SALFA|nr:DNA damage-inducible transcript 4-like protein [Salarias fasciatus]
MVYTTALLFGNGVLSEEEMIGRYLSRRPVPGTSSARRGSVESCEESDSSPHFADLEPELRLLQQDVTRQIERCLTEAKASTLHCRALLLPRHMTTRVGVDVVRASADEPCGLRGASVHIYVERKDGLEPAGSFIPDPSVNSTFELSVIFKADKDDGWPPLKHIFDGSKELKLRPEYRLVKRKLYSSASPVIHDFN